MQFGNSTAFWLLALLPVLLLFLTWAFRARRRALERFVEQPLADKLAASVNRIARRWKAALIVSAVWFAVLALTQPRWGFEWREVKHRGVDILVLLDVSKSMLAQDVKPSRLGQAKLAVEDLLKKLSGDRIGLIAFAGTAFVQCPLTVDYDAFRLTLKEAEPRVIPVGGSAIGRAIRTALKAFDASQGRDRAIILITDGGDPEDEGDALIGATEASKQGIRIFIVGVGGNEPELIPIKEGGKLGFMKDKEGKPVKSRLNEQTLLTIKEKASGIYVRSAAGDFGLEAIYDEGIAQLQKKEHEARLHKRYFERFQWPLGVAVVLLVIEMFATDRRKDETARRRDRETLRKSAGALERRSVAVAGALCALLAASASADTASRLYEQGKYEEAFKRYESAAAKDADNWPLFYNLGAAAYKAGKPDEAAKAFGRTIGSPDRLLQARSFYNLGNSYFRMGEAQEQQAPEKALPSYEASLKAYESTLALDPKDEDALFNRDLVQKKIEELQKQQEQQQQQKDPKKDDQKQDEKKDQDQQQNQQQQQQKDEQQSEKPGEKQEQQRDQSKPEEKKGDPEQNPQPQSGPTNNFDRMQAAVLLDKLLEEERNWNFFPELQKDLKDTGEPEKDW